MPLTLYVDADACPVKDEILQAGNSFEIPIVMVSSFNHRIDSKPGVKVVQVDSSDQAVDLYIANRIRPGDVLVTQDFGLAALALAKQAVVISNRGQLISGESIDFLLERRNEQARNRRAGKHTKGPRALKSDDKNHFLQTLTKVLSGMQENETNAANSNRC